MWRKDEKFVFMYPCIRFRGCTLPLSVLHRGVARISGARVPEENFETLPFRTRLEPPSRNRIFSSAELPNFANFPLANPTPLRYTGSHTPCFQDTDISGKENGMQKRRTDVEVYCDQINAANIVRDVSCTAERVLAECAERCGRQDAAQRIKQRMYDECTVLDWGVVLLGDYIDSQTLTLDELAYDFAVAQMALCVVLDAYGEATELFDAFDGWPPCEGGSEATD